MLDRRSVSPNLKKNSKIKSFSSLSNIFHASEMETVKRTAHLFNPICFRHFSSRGGPSVNMKKWFLDGGISTPEQAASVKIPTHVVTPLSCWINSNTRTCSPLKKLLNPKKEAGPDVFFRSHGFFHGLGLAPSWSVYIDGIKKSLCQAPYKHWGYTYNWWRGNLQEEHRSWKFTTPTRVQLANTNRMRSEQGQPSCFIANLLNNLLLQHALLLNPKWFFLHEMGVPQTPNEYDQESVMQPCQLMPERGCAVELPSLPFPAFFAACSSALYADSCSLARSSSLSQKDCCLRWPTSRTVAGHAWGVGDVQLPEMLCQKNMEGCLKNTRTWVLQFGRIGLVSPPKPSRIFSQNLARTHQNQKFPKKKLTHRFL